MTYTQQQLDEELSKLLAPKVKMPKMYSFDQVQQLLIAFLKQLNEIDETIGHAQKGAKKYIKANDL